MKDSCLDKAGESYWEESWDGAPLRRPIDPHRGGLRNSIRRRFHSYFEKVLKPASGGERCLLEIGCAQSVYLPYFSKYFGFAVSGLDRSIIGCERARAILAREKVPGEIYCADMFFPPTNLLSKFDVVFSWGVVEHFTDTKHTIQALGRFLRPDGAMITIIPNLVGIGGILQKVLDRSIFDVHVPIDRETLASAHGDAGMNVETCEYFLFMNLLVPNLSNWPKTLGRLTYGLGAAITAPFLVAEEHTALLCANRFTSPYIICVARMI